MIRTITRSLSLAGYILTATVVVLAIIVAFAFASTGNDVATFAAIVILAVAALRIEQGLRARQARP